MNLFKKNQKAMHNGTECIIRSEAFDSRSNERVFYLYPIEYRDRYFVCRLGEFEVIQRLTCNQRDIKQSDNN